MTFFKETNIEILWRKFMNLTQLYIEVSKSLFRYKLLFLFFLILLRHLLV